MRKKISLLLLTVAMLALGAVASFATPVTPLVGMGTAITSLSDDILAGIAVVAPVALAVVAAFLVWKLGMKFFKGLAK